MIYKEYIGGNSELLEQIKICCEGGQLNEAYDLIEYFQEEIKEPNRFEEMKLTMLKGIVCIKRGDYKIAEESLLRSIDLANNIEDKRAICNRYDNLVTLYTSIFNVDRAIYFLRKSIELKEIIGNDADIARSLLQLSSLMFSIKDLSNGKDVLHRAGSLIDKLQIPDLKSLFLFSKTVQLRHEKRYDEALQIYETLLKDAILQVDPYLKCRSYINYGDLLYLLQRWEASFENYKKALDIAIDNHMAYDELFINVQLARIKLKTGELKDCRDRYEYIIRQDILGADDPLHEDIAELGANLCDAEGKKEEALKSYQHYMTFYKKHKETEQSRTVLYAKSRYESEKRERELQEARLQQVESELKAVMAEKALLKTEKRFKALIENGSEMIVILDEELIPRYASPSVYKTIGVLKDAVRNQRLHELIYSEDVFMVVSNLNHSKLSPGIALTIQFRMLQQSGSYRWIESTVTNLLHDENVNGIVCNLKDITERKQAEEAIQDLNRSLELKIEARTHELAEAVKDLEAFSYSVSHDLRSPLRVIAGYGKLLQADAMLTNNPELREYVDIILDNSRRMGQLIDDLLNFSKMGRKAVYKSNVNMDQMVQEVILEFRRADPTITKDIVIHELPLAFCDLALIKQVWINLISNAIKYSGKRSKPKIEIGCISKFNENVYYVKDNGAGFDMRYANKLFSVFKRLHDRSEFEGMGVGLALAARIVRMHEGRIWADAESGKGATFYFTLGFGD